MSLFPEESRKYTGNLEYFRPNQLIEGDEARIRILTPKALVGWEKWPEPNKPFRCRLDNPQGGSEGFKQFYAFIVWNYDIKRLQIWIFAQVHVKKALEALYRNKGCPTGSDIFVSSTGKDKDKRYNLRPAAPSKLSKEVAEIFEDTPFNLHALYVGKEPFRDLEDGKQEESNDASVA